MKNSILDFILSTDGMYETIQQGREYERLCEEANNVFEKLMSMLNDDQKTLLDKFTDAQLGQECESSDTYFKEGVKFGVRFILECLND